MNTNLVLNAYFDVQNELHKKVGYHTSQEPKFNNLIKKIGNLCSSVKKEHDSTPEMLWTKYGFAENFLAYPNGDATPHGLDWLRYFDKTVLDPEYSFRKEPTHDFLIVLQGNLICDLLSEPHAGRAIVLMWLLVESVHRQCYRACSVFNFSLPSLSECYCSVAYPPKESTN